jgi:hypothetical protein
MAYKAKLAKIIDPPKVDKPVDVALPPGVPKTSRELASGVSNPTASFDEPGDYIIGEYRGFRVVTTGTEKDGTPRKSRLYDLRQEGDAGIIVSVWGTTILDKRVDESGVKVGQMVAVQFMGDVETSRGQSKAHDFRLNIWDAPKGA